MGARSNPNLVLIPKNDKTHRPRFSSKLRLTFFSLFTAQTDFAKYGTTRYLQRVLEFISNYFKPHPPTMVSDATSTFGGSGKPCARNAVRKVHFSHFGQGFHAVLRNEFLSPPPSTAADAPRGNAIPTASPEHPCASQIHAEPGLKPPPPAKSSSARCFCTNSISRPIDIGLWPRYPCSKRTGR